MTSSSKLEIFSHVPEYHNLNQKFSLLFYSKINKLPLSKFIIQHPDVDPLLLIHDNSPKNSSIIYKDNLELTDSISPPLNNDLSSTDLNYTIPSSSSSILPIPIPNPNISNFKKKAFDIWYSNNLHDINFLFEQFISIYKKQHIEFNVDHSFIYEKFVRSLYNKKF